MKVAVWYNNRDIRIEEVPRPTPGDTWGVNFVRDFRDSINVSQWIFTYRTVHQPDVFGVLAFH